MQRRHVTYIGLSATLALIIITGLLDTPLPAKGPAAVRSGLVAVAPVEEPFAPYCPAAGQVDTVQTQ